jgi:hypothetical protein
MTRREELITQIELLNAELNQIETEFVDRFFFNEHDNTYIKVVAKTDENHYTILYVDDNSVSKHYNNLLEFNENFTEIYEQDFNTKFVNRWSEIQPTPEIIPEI